MKNFPYLFLAARKTNEPHFVALATDFRRARLRRYFHYRLLHLHLQTVILELNNHHFHVSQDKNSGRLHRQN